MSDLARAIFDSNHKIVLAVTGGGIGALHDLFITPGASRSILEAIVPYSAEALASFLGGRPTQYCSSATSRSMAMAAFERAKQLSASDDLEVKLLGAACTASLASDRPKRGEHRIHVALQSATTTAKHTVTLVKGRRSRSEEDQVASTLLLNMVHSRLTMANFDWNTGFEDELIESQSITAPESWRKLFAQECKWASGSDGQCGDQFTDGKERIAVYSGAFDPRHDGHEQIARIGRLRFGRVVHEISIQNVDKPALDYLEMTTRAAQFRNGDELVFTRAPTFAQKARLFPGSTFLVGVDTIYRIALPVYYGGEGNRDEAIAELKRLRCRFLVFGRLIEGQFQEFEPSNVPPPLAELCEVVSEREFRVDISSTGLRAVNSSS